MSFFSCVTKKKGFSLVQLLVVIGIIAVLASVVLVNIQEVKKKARDTQRISDLQQIQVAVRTYKDVNSTNILPVASTGELYSSGTVLQSAISGYVSGTIRDPINSGTNQYYYDSSYDCNGPNRAVLIAGAMERANAGNYTSVCQNTPSDLGNGFTPTTNSYVVILQ